MKSTRWLSPPAIISTSHWHRRLSISGNALADIIYPPRCVWCHLDLASARSNGHADNLALCHDCRRRLAPPVSGWCLRCGAPLEGIAAEADECVHCAGETFPWERVVALGRYQGELGQAMVRCKMPRNEPLVLALGRLLFERRAADLQQSRPEIVVPLPMHWLRRLRRHANGPDLLSEALAAQLKLPLKTGALKRHRLTALQVDVLPAQRHVHQRKSFRVGARRQIQGRRVLLVDDVLTTGGHGRRGRPHPANRRRRVSYRGGYRPRNRGRCLVRTCFEKKFQWVWCATGSASASQNRAKHWQSQWHPIVFKTRSKKNLIFANAMAE